METKNSYRFFIFLILGINLLSDSITHRAFSVEPETPEHTLKIDEFTLTDNLKITTKNNDVIVFFDIHIPEEYTESAYLSLKQNLGNSKIIFIKQAKRNRYNELTGMIFTEQNIWLQHSLLERGLAYLTPSSSLRDSSFEKLQKAEQRARSQSLGLWKSKTFTPTPSDDLETLIGLKNSYQIIQGIVKNTALIKGQTYINFGEDWHTDFTAVIQTSSTRNALKNRGLNPENLVGKNILVRGWLEFYNGPMIKIKHAQSIQWQKTTVLNPITHKPKN